MLHSNDGLALLPASNQKLLTALGALELFPPTTTFSTVVAAAGPVVDGVVQGDLVLIGGGDATLAQQGPHSLGTLAEQLAAAGLRGVNGSIVVDESRYPVAREAPGWRPQDVPESAGPLSALMVDHNEYRGDEEFLADPMVVNGEVFRLRLSELGIGVAAPTHSGTAPPGATVLTTLTSPTVPELVASMLTNSDNEIAELLTREAGRRTVGVATTEAGTKVLAQAIRPLCSIDADDWADASGLSRDNRVTARELADLLHAAHDSALWPQVQAGLPVGGVSGTLQGRFVGTAAQGNVAAKTGYLDDARALSGTLVTAGGRLVFFSILVNGPTAPDSVGAIDDLVVALAEDAS